ncbi:MAG: XRE family transcriptional regulator [Atopobiaceae bacterium]|nr:XRE family transcriptional regulator [Atopobiaceae bacterium]
MASLDAYLEERGVSDEQMHVARRHTHERIEAYALREARLTQGRTQVELAESMEVSQNRVSRMENGDLASMSIDTIRRYVEALGGRLSIVADMPTVGKITLL